MKRRRVLGDVIVYVLLTLGALVVFVPLLWMLSTSLKTESELFLLPVRLFPEVPQWRNYIDVWHIQPFTLFFLNTIFITLLAMGAKF